MNITGLKLLKKDVWEELKPLLDIKDPSYSQQKRRHNLQRCLHWVSKEIKAKRLARVVKH